jgi:hypothetical protein
MNSLTANFHWRFLTLKKDIKMAIGSAIQKGSIVAAFITNYGAINLEERFQGNVASHDSSWFLGYEFDEMNAIPDADVSADVALFANEKEQPSIQIGLYAEFLKKHKEFIRDGKMLHAKWQKHLDERINADFIKTIEDTWHVNKKTGLER